MFESWRLPLEELVCLLLSYQPSIPQGPQKALALLHISRTQVSLIVNEIVHQVVVFASNFHISHIIIYCYFVKLEACCLELVAFIL